MKKVLIAYFSHEGEAYVGGKIVKLKIGNTRVAAQMVHGLTGGDVFRIETEKPYPDDHMETVELAKSEQNAKVRPVLKADALKMDDYDTVILGYPNWWGDMPMIVYNFLESYDFSEKTVIPFCTHGGSGLSGTESTIEDITGAEMMDGFDIAGATAQNRRDKANEAVSEWLREGGFIE